MLILILNARDRCVQREIATQIMISGLNIDSIANYRHQLVVLFWIVFFFFCKLIPFLCVSTTIYIHIKDAYTITNFIPLFALASDNIHNVPYRNLR